MSKLSLDREKRVEKLSGMLGNDFLKGHIKAALKKDNLPQMIIFSGPFGNGKTTLARILAKSILCTQPQGGEACGVCATCTKLSSDLKEFGSTTGSLGYFEYDITKFNGTQDTKKIVAQMQQRTSGNRKRVFILDEVHRASSEAQADFLKFTEEPVPNTYVFICTTDPEKLLKPLVSRFITYKVQKPSEKDLAEYLAKISEEKGINAGKKALRMIVKHSDRTPRSCLKMLDELSVHEKITLGVVSGFLGVAEDTVITKFLDNCKAGRIQDIILLLEEYKESGANTDNFMKELGDYLTTALYAKTKVGVSYLPKDVVQGMTRKVKQFSENELMDMMKIVRNYYNVDMGKDFVFLTVAVEIMDALNSRNRMVNVKPNIADKRYREVTEEVQMENKEEYVEKEASELDIMQVFEDVKIVEDTVLGNLEESLGGN